MMGGPLETVTVSIVGASGAEKWERCTLTASAEDAVRKASFTYLLPPLAEIATFAIRPNMPATIMVGGELWLTGRVGSVSPGHAEDLGEIGVEIYSDTLDTVESSVDHPTGHIKDADALAIAREFESAGVNWRSVTELAKLPWHDVDLGESNFETVERVLRSQGKLLYDDENGAMVIAGEPEGRHAGGLVLGKNIRGADGKLTSEGLHNPIKVRGQNSAGHGPGALRMEGELKNPALKRKRPKVFLLEGDVNEAAARERAEWEAKRAAGNSKTTTATAIGWRDDGGRLWTRNWLVGFDDPLVFLKQDMIIKQVALHQDGGENGDGTHAILQLADPQALGGEGGKSESDEAWATPNEKAVVRAQ